MFSRFFLCVVMLFASSLAAHASQLASMAVPTANAIHDIGLYQDASIRGEIDLSQLNDEVVKAVKRGEYKVVTYVHVPNDLWYIHPFRRGISSTDVDLTPSAKGVKATFKILAVNRVGQPARVRDGEPCDLCRKGQDCGVIAAADHIGAFLVKKSFDEGYFCGRLFQSEFKTEYSWKTRKAQSEAQCYETAPRFLSDVIDEAEAYGFLDLDPSAGGI